MASRKENLKGLVQNARTRVIIIITALILIFTMFYGYVHFSKAGSDLASQSTLRSAPNIQSIPGALNQTSEYANLQSKQNLVQAQKALQSGASAIPTIINVQKFGDGVTEVGPQGGTGGLGFSSLASLGDGPLKAFWMDDLQNTNCSTQSLKTAVQNGAGITSLKNYCSCQQLKDFGYKINDLNTVCDCGELRVLGFSALELKNIGFNAGQLRQCGYSACAEKAAGFSALEMKNAGFPDAELKGAGFSNAELAQASGLPFGMSAEDVLKKGCNIDAIKDLKSKGVSAAAIKRISGCGIDQLKNAGFSPQELKDAGFTAADLLNSGFTPADLKKAGYSAKDLLDAGVSPDELAAAGYADNEIKRALSDLPKNITPADIRQNGCSIDALKNARAAGVSAKIIAKMTKCSPEALLRAGYTPDELIASGYSPAAIKAGLDKINADIANDIKAAGCDPQKLADLKKRGISADAIISVSDCPPEALKAAGFSAGDLLKAGLTPQQLAKAGFNPDDIKQGLAQVAASLDAIRQVGCDPQKLAQLRNSGVKAETILLASKCPPEALKAAGFSAADLLKAGVTPDKLAKAGFNADEIKAGQAQVDADLADAIKAAGCDAEKLAKLQKQGVSAAAVVKANGCSPNDLKKAGFTARDLLKAGFTPDQLTAAGFTPQDIQDAQNSMIDALAAARKNGCTPEAAAAAKAQGMTAQELRQTLGCSLAALKGAGYNAKDLKDAGFSPGELAKAGYSPKDLLSAGFTPADLKGAGYSAADLVAAGVTPKDLLDAGFTPADLLNAGVNAKDLLNAGVSPADLKKAGVSAKDLFTAGVTPAELSSAGFTATDLQAAGVGDADLAKIGLDPKLAALANVADVNLKKDDAPSISSMLQGGNQSSDVKKNADQLDKLMLEQKKTQAQQKFQQKIQSRVAGMQSFAQQLMSGWKTTATQSYVGGTAKKDDKDAAAIAGAGKLTADQKQQAANGQESMDSDNAPVIKTGDILFAVVDTSVNSDEPGPLLATITNGPLKGSKLIGSFAAGSTNADKLTVNFNALSVPWLTKTVSISAYAIDPNTGRTALSSSTNHHYLERYGALFASTFLEGFGNAFQSADTTITIGGTGGETNTTVQNGINRSLTDNAVIGLATVGKAWGQQAQTNMNTPTTIQIYSGTPVGVLFLQDVSIAEK